MRPMFAHDLVPWDGPNGVILQEASQGPNYLMWCALICIWEYMNWPRQYGVDYL